LYVDDSAVKHIEEEIDQGLAVRVAKGKRLGQSSASCSTLKEAEMTAMTAVRMAGLSPVDNGFSQFPASGGKFSVDPKVWDDRVAHMTGEQLAEIARHVVESSTDGDRVKVPKGLIRVARVESSILNSNGVYVDFRNTLVYLNFSTMTDGAKPGEGVESFYSPHLSGLDPDAIERSLREKALASSETVAFKGRMRGQTVILPDDLADHVDVFSWRRSERGERSQAEKRVDGQGGRGGRVSVGHFDRRPERRKRNALFELRR
jgi:predicted Zn-dependent protease